MGGGLGGHTFKNQENIQTAGPIGTKFVDSSGNGYAPNKLSRETHLGEGGLGGQTIKGQRKLSNGWTDWHQFWFTSTDSSGNEYRLNKSRPSIPQGHVGGGGLLGGHKFKRDTFERDNGGTWGVLGGQTIKGQRKLSNGLTDWHQFWFTSADSSGNGYRLNTSRPSIPQGA